MYSSCAAAMFLALPPLWYLLIPLSCEPKDCAADLRNTNSPGSSMAGTVSPLPLPGTQPPLLNLLTRPPLLPLNMSEASLVALPKDLFKPPKPPPSNFPPAHAAALAATKAPRIGRTGARALPICVIALASFNASEAMV